MNESHVFGQFNNAYFRPPHMVLNVVKHTCSLALMCLDRQTVGQNADITLEIHTEFYILIDLCSVDARVNISTGSNKFYPVAI